MSVIMDVADALVTLLNAHDFSLEFTAIRDYVPLYDLEHVKTLRVSVVSAGQEIEGGTRSDYDYDYAVDIGVQKKVDPSSKAELDALTDLVEEIIEHVLATALGGGLGMSLVEMKNVPIYDPKHLEEKHVFTSVVTATYTSCR